MITRRDLDEQIERIKGKINQTPDECVRLAAYYTIRDHLNGADIPLTYGDAPPVSVETKAETIIGTHGDSEFLTLIAGKEASQVLKVIDETMDALKVMEPRLYAGVLRKIQQ